MGERNREELQLIELAKKDAQDMLEVDEHNEKSAEHYTFLVRTEGSK